MVFVFFGCMLAGFGFLLCLTIFGAVIGIPLMFLGFIFMAIGFALRRRKTVITNVVQVSNAPQPVPAYPTPQYAAPVARDGEKSSVASRVLYSRSAEKPCPQCRAANDDASKFCRECGSRLDAPPPTVPDAAAHDADASACPACGTVNDPANRFCDGCGARRAEGGTP